MAAAPELAEPSSAPAGGERYVGPRPFEPQDRDVFFGRDGETLDLVALVVAYRVVLLYAASGAGKTSLLNAGLVPALEQEEGFEVLPPARIRPLLAGESLPETVANAFTFGVLCNWSRDLGRDEAEQALAGETVAGFLAGIPHPEDEYGLPRARAVVFDQFEELFTVNLDRWRDREAFVAQIAQALETDPLLRVVIAIREDYLAQLDPFAELLPGGFRGSCRLERLDREAALEAVVGPTRDTPRSYAPGVAEGLVDDLLTMQVEASDGSAVAVKGEYVEPVQLQVACRSLWERLPDGTDEITAEHLEHFGNVDEVLAGFYVEAVRAAATRAHVRESSLRRQVERALLTPGGTRGTAYRDRKTTGGIPNAAVDELEARHLVRAERRSGARWYELTHDRLIGPLRASNAAYFRDRTRRRARFGAVALALALAVAGALVAVFVSGGGNGAENAAAVQTAIAQGNAVAQQQASLAGLVTHIFPGTRALADAAVSPNGLLIAAASEGGDIPVWDASTRTPLRTTGVPSVASPPAEAVAFSPDGRYLVASDAGGKVRFWDRAGAALLGTVTVGSAPVRALAFAPSGGALLAGDDQGQVVYWRSPDSRTIPLLRTDPPVRSLEFEPGRPRLLMTAGGSAVRIYDVGTGKVVATYAVPRVDVNAATFSPDGSLVAAAMSDGIARVWSTRTGRLLGLLPGTFEPATGVAFSPDGARIAVSTGATVRVWYWPDVEALHLGTHAGVKVFQKRIGIAADGVVGPVTLQAIQTTLQPTVLAGQRGPVTSVAFVPDGGQLVTSSRDGTVWTWGEFAAGPSVRARIVQAAHAGVENESSIGFLRVAPLPKEWLPRVPATLNGTTFVTWCYWQAGAPDPNGNDYSGPSWTGALLGHGRLIPKDEARPGDLVVFGADSGRLAAVVVETGPDPLLAVHPDASGPKLVRLSRESELLGADGSVVRWLDPLD
jgi:WD40 repeat protein